LIMLKESAIHLQPAPIPLIYKAKMRRKQLDIFRKKWQAHSRKMQPWPTGSMAGLNNNQQLYFQQQL
ncbi:MAG: hypothetical protein WCP55_06740, partial [Lentisphaerota bacterium]